jgi:DNA polymerase elongation subunit (family B)
MQLHPMQIGPAFNDIYSGWIDRRIAAKRAGDKKVADSLKTLVNGTFGKTGSVWSILYAPDLMLAVTLGGQLSLFMLIEQLELSGLRVVSANTDGVVVPTSSRMVDAGYI